MKISCPSCEAKYSIGDDKVQSRLAKIRCRKCGVDIVIDGRVQPPTITVGESHAAAPEAMQAAAAASQSYTIDFGENDQRTLTLDEVVAAYNSSQVTPETFVWADGMGDWTPLGQVPEIVDALNAAATGAAQSSAATQRNAAATRAITSPTSTAKSSTRASGRGAADLFGSLAHAGGEEDMARQAAFSEPAAPQQTTGARNESSVLFSLSALTSSAKTSPGPAQSMGFGATSTSREDSGLIDLKALTAQASDTSAASAAAAGGAGLGMMAAAPLGGLGAPLGGLGAPLGGMAPVSPALSAAALGDMSYPQKKNRMGLYIGGGIAFGAVVIALVFALKPEPPPPPKVEQAPVIVYKTREPEPIKEAAKPPPTGEPSAAPKAAAPAPKWRGGGGGKPKAKGGSDDSGGSSGPSTPAPAKPSGGKCGCSPSDLACNMRCAAGK